MTTTTRRQATCEEETKRICRVLNINLNHRSQEHHITARRHILVWHLSRIYSIQEVASATGYNNLGVYRIIAHVRDLISVKDNQILFLVNKIEQN